MVALDTGATLLDPPADPLPVPEYAIGLDVGGTKVRGVVTDADGEILAGARTRTRPTESGVLDTIEEVVASLLDQTGIDIRRIRDVGIGIPGVVDPDTGVVAHAVNLGIDQPFDIVEAVGARLGRPGRVHVENDVNAAALGVAHALGLGERSAAVISSGTGLAAGLVIHGRVWRGAQGVAGEIGHIPIDPEGPVCKCGQRGCLEQYASGSAVTRPQLADGSTVSVKQMFARAEEGDAAARSAVDRLAGALAIGIRMVMLSLDPERVILMGGVANAGQPLLDAVRSALRDMAAVSPFLESLRLDERVMLAPELADLPARGAARLRA
ncbi:ROK family protein [Microbacterium sp. 179-I 3D4 NHS]|uniref:ROK family protein n=1 Tax=Microbacterium sp. 179-I 3D4 NHS TaxID=3142381 RepID=UPI00399FE9B7